MTEPDWKARAEVAEARLRLLEAHCTASESSAADYDAEHLEKTGYRSVSTPMLTTEMVRSVLGPKESW